MVNLLEEDFIPGAWPRLTIPNIRTSVGSEVPCSSKLDAIVQIGNLPDAASSHLADLKSLTHDLLYETYRTEKLSKTVHVDTQQYVSLSAFRNHC
jgi:hypothetical protein